jgi:hypothetical protein
MVYFVVYWYVEEPSLSSIALPVFDEISEILCTSDDLLNKYKLTVAADVLA